MTEPDADETVTMSKRERKRLARRAIWLEQRVVKRKAQKTRRKELRATRGEGDAQVDVKKPRYSMVDGSKQRVAIDLAYDEMMLSGELRKCVAQLGYCYAANRRCPTPLQLHFVNFNGASRELFDSMATNAHWDIHRSEKALEEVFPTEEIVYLSAESDNVLERLDDSKVYVIGGLVDHNRSKGYCHARAIEKGFGHARLPIAEHVDLKTRKVLTINHVYEILLRFAETGDWKTAFLSVIPQRKGVEPRREDDNNERLDHDSADGSLNDE